MLNLQVIIASTRPQRVGPAFAGWLVEQAKQHGKFSVELVDLKEINLPFLDEIKHPRLSQYEHAHTKAWSAKVAVADAYVFVTPEYNYTIPAPLVNALDFVAKEWAYKPASFLSYGHASGGTRAVESAKGMLTALKMMPIPEMVVVPFFTQTLDEKGVFKGSATQETAAITMLNELRRWAEALAPLRQPVP